MGRVRVAFQNLYSNIWQNDHSLVFLLNDTLFLFTKKKKKKEEEIAVQIEICVAVIPIWGAFCDTTQGKSNTVSGACIERGVWISIG